MNVPAKLEERISQKTGKPYTCIVIKLTEACEKVVFLENAEVELLKLMATNGQKIKLTNQQ
ncbi:MAG: hypothetical protein FWH14_01645 [Oscillospiraceae bacterium]|nr:hypothetical protein [Oscillospiraceae bacterium]